MPFVRNDSDKALRGQHSTIEPGEVVEVDVRWLRARNDRVRRGQLTVVAEPELPPIEVLDDLTDFLSEFEAHSAGLGEEE